MADAAPMASAERAAVLRLELVAGSEPLRGRLSDERGLNIPFEGWIAFAAAMEHALRELRVSEAP